MSDVDSIWKKESGEWKKMSVPSVNLQPIYDAFFPVNTEHIGFTAPNVPSGVTAVWEDVSSEFADRYPMFSTATAKTEEAESLPIPTLNEVDGHKHTMTPTGSIGEGGEHEHSGIFWGSSPMLPQGGSDFGYNYPATWASNGYSNALVTGKAGKHSHTFTGSSGNTSENGKHTPTVKADDVYKSGASVKPKTITIKVYRRVS